MKNPRRLFGILLLLILFVAPRVAAQAPSPSQDPTPMSQGQPKVGTPWIDLQSSDKKKTKMYQESRRDEAEPETVKKNSYPPAPEVLSDPDHSDTPR